MAPQSDTIDKLRRRIWIERAALFALFAILIGLYLGALPGGRRVCLVMVDGDPVVVLETRADAERLLDELRSTSGFPPERVGFAQQVSFHRVSAARNPVQSDAEAMEALSSKLDLSVSGSAVLADGELVIALPDKEAAVQALSLLIERLAPPGPNTTVFFKEKVEIETRDVPAARLLPSAEEAARKIIEAASPTIVHEVKRGESAWKIARDHEVSLRRLAYVNPGLELNSLRAGAKIKIPGPIPSITVVAQKEIEEQVGEGLDQRTQTVLITYENGMEVKREMIGRRAPTLVTPAPRRSPDPWRWRDEITR